jgi:hypothetical protein
MCKLFSALSVFLVSLMLCTATFSANASSDFPDQGINNAAPWPWIDSPEIPGQKGKRFRDYDECDIDQDDEEQSEYPDAEPPLTLRQIHADLTPRDSSSAEEEETVIKHRNNAFQYKVEDAFEETRPVEPAQAQNRKRRPSKDLFEFVEPDPTTTGKRDTKADLDSPAATKKATTLTDHFRNGSRLIFVPVAQTEHAGPDAVSSAAHLYELLEAASMEDEVFSLFVDLGLNKEPN